MTRPILVASDVHVGAVPPRTERAFREFLDYAAAGASALVINGDLFDAWVPSRRFVMRPYVRVIATLADVVERGLKVYFVGGNHDALEYSETVLREDAGVTVLDDPARIRLGAFNALVAHGDGVRILGREYRKEHPVLRRLLRSEPIRSIAERLLPEDCCTTVCLPGRGCLASSPDMNEGREPARSGTRPASRHGRGSSSASFLTSIWCWLVTATFPVWLEVESRRFYLNTGDWTRRASASPCYAAPS